MSNPDAKNDDCAGMMERTKSLLSAATAERDAAMKHCGELHAVSEHHNSEMKALARRFFDGELEWETVRDRIEEHVKERKSIPNKVTDDFARISDLEAKITVFAAHIEILARFDAAKNALAKAKEETKKAR